jgi:hypothetical protein
MIARLCVYFLSNHGAPITGNSAILNRELPYGISVSSVDGCVLAIGLFGKGPAALCSMIHSGTSQPLSRA